MSTITIDPRTLNSTHLGRWIDVHTPTGRDHRGILTQVSHDRSTVVLHLATLDQFGHYHRTGVFIDSGGFTVEAGDMSDEWARDEDLRATAWETTRTDAPSTDRIGSRFD